MQTGDTLSILTYPTDPPVAGVNTTLSVQLVQQNGTPVTNLDVVHERKLHVFIVGSDLQTFAHVHPEDIPDGFANQNVGTYQTRYDFPAGGEYLVVADYTTRGVTNLGSISLGVLGNTHLPAPSSNFDTTKQFGNYTVTLEYAQPVRAHQEVAFTYRTARDGVPASDIKQWLGSELHLFLVRSDFQYADHTHAYIPGHGLHSGAMPQYYKGPAIPVHYTFSEPGDYVLFGQFQAGADLVTTNFMVHVEPAGNQTIQSYENRKKCKDLVTNYFVVILFCLIFLGVLPVLLWRDRRERALGKK
jgi:hypothetical protein